MSVCDFIKIFFFCTQQPPGGMGRHPFTLPLPCYLAICSPRHLVWIMWQRWRVGGKGYRGRLAASLPNMGGIRLPRRKCAGHGCRIASDNPQGVGGRLLGAWLTIRLTNQPQLWRRLLKRFWGTQNTPCSYAEGAIKMGYYIP